MNKYLAGLGIASLSMIYGCQAPRQRSTAADMIKMLEHENPDKICYDGTKGFVLRPLPPGRVKPGSNLDEILDNISESSIMISKENGYVVVCTGRENPAQIIFKR